MLTDLSVVDAVEFKERSVLSEDQLLSFHSYIAEDGVLERAILKHGSQ